MKYNGRDLTYNATPADKDDMTIDATCAAYSRN